jgi:putative protein-disulfide isomerase
MIERRRRSRVKPIAMSAAETQAVLWYFADPMCSWCWGFTPVMDRIKSDYQDRCRIALMMGGLRPGAHEALPDTSREEILHHWQQVHRVSGQGFALDGALPPGFVYDTEPACRAVVAMGERNAAHVFDYFKSIQHAFYMDQRDVTDAQTLLALAEPFDTQPHLFLEYFRGEDAANKTQAHFHKTRQFGVQGFPTLILQRDDRYHLLTSGYRPFAQIQLELDAVLV